MQIEVELFSQCSVEDIKRGYIEDIEGYTCLLCGARFERGEIYTFNGKMYEASKAIQMHLLEEHQSVKHFLLNVQASNMGISDLQLQLLNFFATGLSDKEIAEYLGVSGSTIRNHRFKLRERERQSRLFLALMEMLEEDKEANDKSNIFERGLENRQLEVGRLVNEKERKRIIERYITPSGHVKKYPTYERSKQVVLEKILENFQIGQKYNEEEINYSLSKIYRDYKLLKRDLIIYDYLGRSNKGGVYWIKDYKRRALDKAL